MSYGCISRGDVILAEKGFGNRNFHQMAQSALGDLSFNMNRKTTVPLDELVLAADEKFISFLSSKCILV